MMCVFIYNPNAGNGKIKKHLDYITGRLKDIFGDVTVRSTLTRGDATKFAMEACGTAECLIFAGGDGTFNEILNGVAAMDERPILGYIPQGTTCDMSSNYGLSKKCRKALNIIEAAKTVDIDIMRVCRLVKDEIIEVSYSAYVVAAGFLATISYSTPQKRKKRWGKLAYFAAALKFGGISKTAVIECVEPKSENLSLLTVLKSKNVGGFSLNRDFSYDNGLLQVITIRKRSKNRVIGFLQLLLTLTKLRISRRKGDFCKKNIQKFSTPSVLINASGLNWSIDGEEVTAGKLEVSVVPKHIRLFVG